MADTSRVAPELVAALEFFPDIDFSQGMAPFRTGFDARMRPPLPPELEAVSCQQHFIPGAPGDPDVRVLHYTPPGQASGPLPAVLHIHGGGYIMGDPEINDAMNRAIVLAHGCVIVSVDYRLAPEVTWPGALHDCHAAFRWMHAEAAALGIDPRRIVLTGESAGGGHAEALALHIRDLARRGEGADLPRLRLVLLDSPMLDDRTGTTTDPHPHCGHFVWTPDKNRFGWTAMLGHETGGAEVPAAAVPARATDVDDLPPHFITVGGLDLFLEECLEWTRRLARAGVAAELHVIPGAYHGFAMAQGSPQVAQLMRLRTEAFASAFAR
jgi:triacylglycerol lipase